ATTDGLFGWDPAGNLLPGSIPGNFFDGLPDGKLLIGADIDDDNIQAYTRDFVLVGETTPGSVDFPEQIQVVSGNRLAVASFSDEAVFFFDLADGTLLSSFPLRNGGNGRGIYELPSGNFLVTDNTNGIDEYDPDGIFIRNIAAGSSFRYIELCNNFTP
ncbi:MAG: YncE family protein, partial [Planctomycetota bacterium]